MDVAGKVAVITGAASGIGRAVAIELARRNVRAMALVDIGENIDAVAAEVNAAAGRKVAYPFRGDTTDEAFRASVFDSISSEFDTVTMCVPAAGITRDDLAVRIDKVTRQGAHLSGRPVQAGPRRQSRGAGLLGARDDRPHRRESRGARTHALAPVRGDARGHRVHRLRLVARQPRPDLLRERQGRPRRRGGDDHEGSRLHGVRCGLIHPGFTDTPMVRAMGDDYIDKHILPFTQLSRLIRPDEIADAICFMLANSAVSGELWADAGWHAPA